MVDIDLKSDGDATPVAVEVTNQGQIIARQILILCWCDTAVQSAMCMKKCANPLDDLFDDDDDDDE